MQPKTISPDFAAAEQFTPEALSALALAGYKSVVSARPDSEQPGQPSAAEMEAAARAAGLEFAHVPVVPGKIGPEDIAKFAAAYENLPKPVCGFCKSGMRATTLWALANPDKQDADARISAAAGAGYDLAPLRGALGD